MHILCHYYYKSLGFIFYFLLHTTVTVDTRLLWKSRRQLKVMFWVHLWNESCYLVFWKILNRTTIGQRLLSARLLAKCGINYPMVTVVPSYLNNFTKVGSKLTLKCTLHVTVILLDIILKPFHPYNNPEKKKTKNQDMRKWDLDMLSSIFPPMLFPAWLESAMLG